MPSTPSVLQQIRRAVNRDRLIDTAVQLISVPSRTCEAGAAADRLATLLCQDGFAVERPVAGHAPAPAVVVRIDTGRAGRTLQFDGHLDTVHLPFVPPQVRDGQITGSGASDMKSGVAAAVEALRVLRETNALPAGSILFTAHDLHEAPWGFGQQLDGLVAAGYVGDAVLIPEPLSEYLPILGRGAATWKVIIRRAGPPVHEVMRPLTEPSVIAAGAELVLRLQRMQDRLTSLSKAPGQGRLQQTESVFVGQIHSGEIYNQYPQECWLEGTRRWLPQTTRDFVESEFRHVLKDVAEHTHTNIDLDFRFIRDAFQLDTGDALVASFQEAYTGLAGKPLVVGEKPFVDDGNSFWGNGVPAITHGPRAGGQHTVNEWVSIDDLVRVAEVYALTAIDYCAKPQAARKG